MQGNPLYSDDIGKMCYNAAKNWQIGWYDDRKLELNPKDRSSTWGTIVRMVGIANYDAQSFPSVSSLPVLVKLETQTSNDYFIAFNRAFGINSENDEADDEVTIVQTGQNGLSYSQSWLRETLKEGEEYVISGLGASGTDLIVSLTSITKNEDLWIANLWIGTSQSTTSSPSASPIAASYPLEETQSPSSSTNLPSASPVPQEPTCLLIKISIVILTIACRDEKTCWLLRYW